MAPESVVHFSGAFNVGRQADGVILSAKQKDRRGSQLRPRVHAAAWNTKNYCRQAMAVRCSAELVT
jgi:uncharacterized protein YeaC (DUF1315 family)